MLFNPVSVVSEARHLVEIGVPDPYKLLTVEVGALVTTPFHVASNRLREIARSHTHGSCGMGIGETQAYAIACGEGKWGGPYGEVPFTIDLKDPKVFRDKCALLRERLMADLRTANGDYYPVYDPDKPEMAAEWDILEDFEGTMAILQPYVDRIAKYVDIVRPEWLDEELAKDQTIVFEGAQGVLLDENHGFHPHTTWSTTTFKNAEKLVRRVKGVQVTTLGILRGYMTRHGAGPFVTEDSSVPVPASEHNGRGEWQANFRMGHFDAVMARYALQVVGGVDELALTCLDHLTGPIKAAWDYVPKHPYRGWGGNEIEPHYGTIPYRPYEFMTKPTVAEEKHDLDMHLWFQERLTHILQDTVKPFYSESPDIETFVAKVETELKTPVKLLSFGPKASDKKTR